MKPAITLVGNLHDLVAQVCAPAALAICRVCGCTDNDPCFTDAHGGVHRAEGLAQYSDAELEAMPLVPCHWIEHDLCSACVADKAPPLLYDGYGRPLRGAL